MNNLGLPRILIYQDEDCSILIDYLKYYGFSIIPSTTDDIINKIKEQNYDMCILGHYGNINLSTRLKPLKFLREIDKHVPIIMVSDKINYEYIIEAFNNGADDYVVRPYNIEELICRINALFKRCGIKVRKIELVYNLGDYIFNVENKSLTLNNIEMPLNNKICQLLSLLCAYKNEILPKSLLIRQIWIDDNYYNKRSLDVHICTLRNMLKMDSRIEIKTYRNIGYSLIITEEENLM